MKLSKVKMEGMKWADGVFYCLTQYRKQLSGEWYQAAYVDHLGFMLAKPAIIRWWWRATGQAEIDLMRRFERVRVKRGIRAVCKMCDEGEYEPLSPLHIGGIYPGLPEANEPDSTPEEPEPVDVPELDEG